MADNTPTPQHTAIRHDVEFEQGGTARAAYGKRLLPLLAERLTQEFGKGFDERNLRHMRAFFQAFPIWDAVRSELSWTHYRLLTRVDKAQARQWYMNEAAEQNWSSRAFVRDPVMLEFLGLPGSGKLLESSLEQGLMDKLQAFLLALGKGFAFVARQQRISTESKDFYIDCCPAKRRCGPNWRGTPRRFAWP